MEINRRSVLKAQALIASLEKHIVKYLGDLQMVEAALIKADKYIASGGYGCHHFKPSPLFHVSHLYAPYSKIPIRYRIVSCDENAVTVIFNGMTLPVPYKNDQKAFSAFCDTLFSRTKKAMKLCRAVKARHIKAAREAKKDDADIKRTRVSGGISYRWKECHACSGSGHVQVGTGKFEDDPFTFSDSPATREITAAETCPACNGTKGLVVVVPNNGVEKQFPCCKEIFQRNKDRILFLLAITP